MDKVKKFINDYKALVIIFIVCTLLIGVEVVIINSKTNGKSKKTNDLNVKMEQTKEQKKIMGITSNSNSNSSNEDLIEKSLENTKEKENEKNSEAYNKYDGLTDEQKEKVDTKPSKTTVTYDEIDKIKDSQEDLSEIPSKFNLGEKYKLNFEMQNYGLCWDYSAMKALETYLQIHNLGTYNFSEAHVDYVVSDKLYGSRSLNNGGMFSDWVKYSVINEGFVEKSVFGDEEKEYTLDEYSKFIDMDKKKFIVTDIVQFPFLSVEDGKFYTSTLQDKELTDEEFEDYLNVLKKHIMTNGAIQTTINTTYMYYPNLYIPTNFEGNDHGVTIVGWDDNYSKDKFIYADSKYNEDTDSYNLMKTDRHPKRDGAFIVVNSWSTDELYYYVSYEDPSLYYTLYGISSVNDFSNAIKLSNYSTGFKKAIKNEIGEYIVSYNGEEYIPNSITSDIYALDLSNSDLVDTDLSALAYFKNLRSLNLSNNKLTSLKYLPNLKDIYDINISDNNITDISMLSKYDLVNLSAENNNILDMSSFKSENTVYYLSGNKNITGYENLSGYVDLSNCNIETFTSSSSFEILDLSDNPLKSIAGDFSVNSLYLRNDGLNDISFLSNINTDELYSIYLNDNNITDIELLKNIKNLFYIDLSGNKNISNLNILKDIYNENRFDNKNDISYSDRILGIVLTSLKKLDDDYEETDEYDNSEYMKYNLSLIMSDCDISDISFLKDLYITSKLDLSNNSIKSVNGLSVNESIIDLSNNPLEDDSYKDLINSDLNALLLSNCGLKDLNPLKNIDVDLSILDVSNNQIKDLSPLYGKTIYNLSLANNTDIKGDLSKIESLSGLNISNCNVDNNTFNIDDLSKLNVLNIGKNKMFNKYKELFTDDNNISLIFDNEGIDFSVLPEIDDIHYRVSGTFIINYSANNGVINLKDNKMFSELVRNNKFSFKSLKLYNGTYNKYADKIVIENVDKNVIFNRPYYIGSEYEDDVNELNIILKVN